MFFPVMFTSGQNMYVFLIYYFSAKNLSTVPLQQL